METDLRGKGVVVTGASGGIGAACARAFAAEGARVVVHYHRGKDRARALAEELGAPIEQADLRVEADVDRLFEAARAALGSIDVCAAVAGVYPSEDVPVWELGLERFEATIRDNLTATFLTARGFLREVARAGAGSGSLVLVGSTAGRFGEAGHADYAAAKAAIQSGLLLTLKNEAARLGPRVRVNAVAPGWTASPMTRGMLEEDDVRRITRTMPLRKVATPEDVAAHVVVLASERLSGHVTGELVTVAGGMEGRVLHPDVTRRTLRPPRGIPSGSSGRIPLLRSGMRAASAAKRPPSGSARRRRGSAAGFRSCGILLRAKKWRGATIAAPSPDSRSRELIAVSSRPGVLLPSARAWPTLSRPDGQRASRRYMPRTGDGRPIRAVTIVRSSSPGAGTREGGRFPFRHGDHSCRSGAWRQPRFAVPGAV